MDFKIFQIGELTDQFSNFPNLFLLKSALVYLQLTFLKSPNNKAEGI